MGETPDTGAPPGSSRVEEVVEGGAGSTQIMIFSVYNSIYEQGH